MAQQRKRSATRRPKSQRVLVYQCKDLKAALAKELRTHVKDRGLLKRTIEALGGEVAYGTGGGGGVGVA